MKKIILAVLALVWAASLSAQTRVEAPESPYGFEPLEMFDFPARDFPITKYGAKPGDVESNMKAFAKAIAACNKAGGGRVVVPAGEWLTGPIHFLSNVELTKHILIEDCTFSQGDDAVVLKAGRNQDGWALNHPTGR